MNAKRIGKIIWTQHGTKILTGLTILGTLAAVAFAWKARPKCEDVLDELNEKGADNLEKAKAIAPIIAPTVGATAIAVGASIMNHKVNSEKLAALASTLSIIKSAHDEYEKATRKEVGEEAEDRIRNAAINNLANTKPVDLTKVVDTGKGNVIFKEVLTGKLFRASKAFVEEVQARLNNDLARAKIEGDDEFEITLNDFYEQFNLETCEFGNLFSWKWARNEFIQVNFGEMFEYGGTEPGYLLKFTRYGSPSLAFYSDTYIRRDSNGNC